MGCGGLPKEDMGAGSLAGSLCRSGSLGDFKMVRVLAAAMPLLIVFNVFVFKLTWPEAALIAMFAGLFWFIVDTLMPL